MTKEELKEIALWASRHVSEADIAHSASVENDHRNQVMKLIAEVRRLRWWLARVTQVDGADDAGGGVWMCALRAQAGLDGKPMKE